jgi:hypothetical protein
LPFIPTAPAALEVPSTLTPYDGPLSDIVGFAVDPVSLDEVKGRTLAPLMFADSAELA